MNPVIYRPTAAANRKRMVGILWLAGFLLLLTAAISFLTHLFMPSEGADFFMWFICGAMILLESGRGLLISCKEIRWEADKLVIVRWNHRVDEVRWDELKAVWTNKDRWKYRGALGLVHGTGGLGHRLTDIPRDYEIADDILKYAAAHSIPIALYKGRTLGMKS